MQDACQAILIKIGVNKNWLKSEEI